MNIGLLLEQNQPVQRTEQDLKDKYTVRVQCYAKMIIKLIYILDKLNQLEKYSRVDWPDMYHRIINEIIM